MKASKATQPTARIGGTLWLEWRLVNVAAWMISVVLTELC